MIKTVIKVYKNKQTVTDHNTVMEVIDSNIYKNMEYLYDGLWSCEMLSYPDQQFTAVNISGSEYAIYVDVASSGVEFASCIRDAAIKVKSKIEHICLRLSLIGGSDEHWQFFNEDVLLNSDGSEVLPIATYIESVKYIHWLRQ